MNSNLLKEWSNSLIELHVEIMDKKLNGYIGKIEEVMITEKGKNGTYVGRDDNYRPVVLKGKYNLYDKIKCLITSHGNNYLIGE